jgi:hypothetical protein
MMHQHQPVNLLPLRLEHIGQHVQLQSVTDVIAVRRFLQRSLHRRPVFPQIQIRGIKNQAGSFPVIRLDKPCFPCQSQLRAVYRPFPCLHQQLPVTAINQRAVVDAGVAGDDLREGQHEHKKWIAVYKYKLISEYLCTVGAKFTFLLFLFLFPGNRHISAGGRALDSHAGHYAAQSYSARKGS